MILNISQDDRESLGQDIFQRGPEDDLSSKRSKVAFEEVVVTPERKKQRNLFKYQHYVNLSVSVIKIGLKIPQP